MGNEKREIVPVALKFGVALALSFGGILYALRRNKSIKYPRKPSDCKNQVNSRRISSRASIRDHQASQTTPTSLHFDPLATDTNDELHHSNNPNPDLSPNTNILPELNELVKEFDTSAAMKTTSSLIKDTEHLSPETNSPKAHSRGEKDSHEQEIKSLRNSIKFLKERERSLEIQLLEFYGLKEQETAVMELQNRLKLNNMESKLFALKIESLQADNRRLHAQMNDYTKAVSDLEAARAKIKTLKKKLRSESEQNKKQILDLQRRVENLPENEDKGGVVGIDPEIESRLHKLKDLEDEVEELRKSNHDLQLEKSDLAQRFDCVQMLATSVLEDGETEKLKEESRELKKQNEDLSKEIERLQADKCADVEELVYLRWINACLRYELRNYQPGPGKTIARDLSKTLSPRSEEKAKQLILEYANKEGAGEKGMNVPEIDSDRWSCSPASIITDSAGEFDESLIDESPPRKPNPKFFGKLMRVFRGKDSHIHHHHRRRDHSRDSSLGRSESGGEDTNACSDSSVGHIGASKRSVDSQKAKRRHSDICLYKQTDSIADGGGRSYSTSSSELVKYAGALKDTREKSKFKLPRRTPSLDSI